MYYKALFFVFLSFLAYAQTQNQQTNQVTNQITSQLQNESDIPLTDANVSGVVVNTAPSILSILQIILILGLMVFALIGVLYVINNRGNAKNLKRDLLIDDGEFIKVVDMKVLSQDKSLYLVKIGTDILLLSSTDNDVNLVSKISDEELLKTISETYIDGKTFAEKLGRSGAYQDGRQGVIDPFSFLKKQGDKLKKM